MIFATWGIVYHYAVWLNNPPTRRFFDRTFELMRAGGMGRSFFSYPIGDRSRHPRAQAGW